MKHKEGSLFSGWSLILFSLIVIAVLLVLFPGKKLLDSFSKNPTDGTSVQYLKELIFNDPENGELRMKLAQKLIFLGKLAEAERTLSRLLDDSELKNEAQFLMIEIQLRQYFNQTSNTTKQTKKIQIINAINTLYPALSDISSLDMLAQWSYELAEPAVAATIYQKIGDLFDHEKVGKNKEINSFFSELVGIQHIYAEKINKDAEYYAVKHLDALLAANLLEEAFIQTKKYTAKFSHSEKILVQAIKVATLSGKPYQSRDWGRKLLAEFGIDNEKLTRQITLELTADDARNSLTWADGMLSQYQNIFPSLLAYGTSLASSLGEKEIFRKFSVKQLEQNPNDPVLLSQLVKYELALNELNQALQHASRIVVLDPENVKARKQLAKVALWNGAPHYAMQQFSWLYRKTADEAYLKDAIKIGKDLFQYARVAKNYEILSNKRRLEDSELKDLFDVLKQTGFSDGGRRQLKQYLNKWPDHKQARAYLASIEELSGKYDEAVQQLTLKEQYFGKTAKLSRKKIEMLIKAGNYNEAWEQLSRNAATSQPEDSEFWKFYSQIAWMLGYEQAAEKAYLNLLNHGAIEQGDINRLLQLSYKGEENEQQLELLLIAWDKFKQDDYLLDAIDLSERLKKPEQTAELIAIADNNSPLFENSIRFWNIKAMVANRNKDRLLTRKYLLKALALDTQSVNTRIALLWHMIEYDSDSSIRTMIKSSIPLAGNNTELWEAIAAGYLRLGEPKRAIPWYLRSVQQKPDDYLLLLGYADTLKEAGEKTKAKKINHFVMSQVRPQLVANLLPMDPELAEFKRRYGNVVHQAFGPNITEKWFKKLQRENEQVKQVLFDEYRITWLLAEGRIDSARRYLLKSLHKRLATPSWQNMAIAVRDNNIEKIDQLLNGPDELSPANQVVGLRTVGREQDALIAARSYMDNSQNEEEILSLRRQAGDLAVRNPNGFAVTGKAYNISELDIWSVNPEVVFTHGADSFWVNYQYLDFSSSNSNLTIQPGQKKSNNLSFKWRRMGLRNELWLQGHAELRGDKDLYGIKGLFRYQIVEGWSAKIETAYNELSKESAAFRVMGVRDRITLGFNGGFSKRDYFSFNVHGRSFKTRYGAHLGTGYGADFSAGYRVKFAQPAVDINIHGILSESDLDTQLPPEMQAVVGKNGRMKNVLSDSYKETGLNLKIYDGEARPFGFVEKSFHYYLNTGIFFTSPWTGTGVLVEAGLGTRLFLHDDLSLIGRYVDSQGGVNTTATQSIELRYSLRLDELYPSRLF